MNPEQVPQDPQTIDHKKHLSPKTWVPALIVIAVIAAYFLTVTPETSPPQNDGQRDSNTIANWQTCENQYVGYRVEYPPEWKIWSPPSFYDPKLVSSCEASSYIYFSPGLVVDEEQRFGIERSVVITVRKSGPWINTGTIFDDTESIDDYFSRVPKFLEKRPVVDQSFVDGEKLVWLEDDSAMTVHDGKLYEFRWHNVEDSILQRFFGSLEFIDLAPPVLTDEVRTYRNEEFGFEFQHPVSQDVAKEEGLAVTELSCFWFTDDNESVQTRELNGDACLSIGVSLTEFGWFLTGRTENYRHGPRGGNWSDEVVLWKSYKSLDDFLQRYCTEAETISCEVRTNSNGVTYIRSLVAYQSFGPPIDTMFYHIVRPGHEMPVILLSNRFSVYSDVLGDEESIELLDGIVESFKFID